MVKRVLFCFLFFVATVQAADDVNPLERVLLEQEVVLTNQKMNLKVSLATRNLWYQQGLKVMVDITTEKTMPSLSAQLLMSGSQPWQDLSITPEVEPVLLDGVIHYRWQAVLFPKQLGVQDLPNLRLRLEGTGGAQKTISLPNLSVYVRSLPIYVPSEAWVGKADTSPIAQSSASWILVGDQQMKTWQWRVQGLWSKAINLPAVSGKGIIGLNPWLEVQHEWLDGQYWTSIRAQQPWTASEMGRWTVGTQDFWLFDGQTGKVGHWQLAGDGGVAIAPWLWRILQGLVAMIVIGLLMLLIRWMRCRLRQRYYRQGIVRALDAQQLLHWCRVHWQFDADVPVAHQAQGLPIATELIALEGLLFSEQVLHGNDFKTLKAQLLARNAMLPC